MRNIEGSIRGGAVNMRGTAQEFKTFLLRGNVIDLAVAVVIGAAFGTVVTAVVEGIITPLIGIFGGVDHFGDLTFSINGSNFAYGDVINKVISFLIIAAVIFFLVIKPMNLLVERARREPIPSDPTEKKCPYCLSEVPIAATRCAYCTSEIAGSV